MLIFNNLGCFFEKQALHNAKLQIIILITK